jgi:hypothetical protein
MAANRSQSHSTTTKHAPFDKWLEVSVPAQAIPLVPYATAVLRSLSKAWAVLRRVSASKVLLLWSVSRALSKQAVVGRAILSFSSSPCWPSSYDVQIIVF